MKFSAEMADADRKMQLDMPTCHLLLRIGVPDTRERVVYARFGFESRYPEATNSTNNLTEAGCVHRQSAADVRLPSYFRDTL